MLSLEARPIESEWTIHRWNKESADYPGELRDLPQPPEAIYAIGRASALEKPRVAIVGTRDCTGYGERSARMLTRALVRAGVSIISGMARGIDAAAHRTAIEEGGNTVAVLGTGIDVPYPVGHRQLHRTIAEKGIVISENPPGTKAYQGAFPKRNRIIAALAPLTIVVEAGFRSGALNTAAQALALGRTVAAVPGPIDSEQSRGCNHLIQSGAQVVTATDDVFSLLGIAAPTEKTMPPLLPDTEQRVWDAVKGGSVLTDCLPEATGLGLPECLAAITSLEIMGLFECSLAGEIRRR